MKLAWLFWRTGEGHFILASQHAWQYLTTFWVLKLTAGVLDLIPTISRETNLYLHTSVYQSKQRKSNMNTETNQRCGDGDNINHHCSNIVTNGFKSLTLIYQHWLQHRRHQLSIFHHVQVLQKFTQQQGLKIIKDAVPITGHFDIEDPRESTAERQREPQALPWWKRHYKAAIVSCIFLLAVFGMIVALVVSLQMNRLLQAR